MLVLQVHKQLLGSERRSVSVLCLHLQLADRRLPGPSTHYQLLSPSRLCRMGVELCYFTLGKL
jgi:hypothetical protein